MADFRAPLLGANEAAANIRRALNADSANRHRAQPAKAPAPRVPMPCTRNDFKCLAWGPGDNPVELVLPAGSNIDSALSLAAGMMETASGLARDAMDDSGATAGSVRWAITWLAEIAFCITEGVREDLARNRADQSEASGDEA